MNNNCTWLAFANEKVCRHADAICKLGFINWKMERTNFAVGDVVYLFMSDERCVRFKMVVAAKDCKRQDQKFWVGKAPDDRTFKLVLVKEYEGDKLSEVELTKYEFHGGRSLQHPIYKNTKLIDYIKSVL